MGVRAPPSVPVKTGSYAIRRGSLFSSGQGRIIVAGAGHFANVEMVESKGVDFPAADDVSPEMLAEAWAGITDMSGAEPFAEAMAAVQRVFANLNA